MATITVGPSGRDYTTIQDAVGAAANGDTIAIYAGTYTRAGTVPIVDGPSVSRTGIWLRPMEAGVILDGQNTNRYGIIANTDWTIGSTEHALTIRGVASYLTYSGGVVGNATGSGSTGPTGVTIQRVRLESVAGRPWARFGAGFVADRCTVASATDGCWVAAGAFRRCLWLDAVGWNSIDANGLIEQCGVVVNQNVASQGVLSAHSGGSAGTIRNTWIYVTSGHTLAYGLAAGTHVNNAFLGTITARIYGGGALHASEIGDATPTPADYFTDAGAEDYTPVIDAVDPDLVDAGTDLSGSFTVDLDGTTFVTWDIGPYAYVAPPPPPDPEPPGTDPGWESYWFTDDGPPAGTPSGWDPYPVDPTPTIAHLAVATLLTDARADVSEVPPGQSRRGWWGDAYGEPAGSLLWTLPLRQVTADTPGLAERYAREALQWLIDDGHVTALSVRAEVQGARLAIEVTLTRREGDTETVALPDLWEVYRG